MKYRHLLASFLSQPLAILPEKMAQIREFLATKSEGDDIDPATVQTLAAQRQEREATLLHPQAVRRDDGVQMYGKVALVPVMGTIMQRASLMSEFSGGVSTEKLGSTIDSLVADKTVRCIVLVYDSPGGSVFGVQELAAKLLAARDEKKCLAMVDSVAASAAYWLASQASEIIVTPGGQVGSIGVITGHTDVTEREKMKGYKTTLVTSSAYKAEFAPEVALSEEARAELQSKVNHYHSAFVGAVAKGRAVSDAKVRSDFGEGRMVTAKDAVSRGMADRVATLEQTLSRLGADSGTSARAEEADPDLLAAEETLRQQWANKQAAAVDPSRLAAIRARATEVE